MTKEEWIKTEKDTEENIRKLYREAKELDDKESSLHYAKYSIVTKRVEGDTLDFLPIGSSFKNIQDRVKVILKEKKIKAEDIRVIERHNISGSSIALIYKKTLLIDENELDQVISTQKDIKFGFKNIVITREMFNKFSNDKTLYKFIVDHAMKEEE